METEDWILVLIFFIMCSVVVGFLIGMYVSDSKFSDIVDENSQLTKKCIANYESCSKELNLCSGNLISCYNFNLYPSIIYEETMAWHNITSNHNSLSGNINSSFYHVVPPENCSNVSYNPVDNGYYCEVLP